MARIPRSIPKVPKFRLKKKIGLPVEKKSLLGRTTHKEFLARGAKDAAERKGHWESKPTLDKFTKGDTEHHSFHMKAHLDEANKLYKQMGHHLRQAAKHGKEAGF